LLKIVTAFQFVHGSCQTEPFVCEMVVRTSEEEGQLTAE